MTALLRDLSWSFFKPWKGDAWPVFSRCWSSPCRICSMIRPNLTPHSSCLRSQRAALAVMLKSSAVLVFVEVEELPLCAEDSNDLGLLYSRATFSQLWGWSVSPEFFGGITVKHWDSRNTTYVFFRALHLIHKIIIVTLRRRRTNQYRHQKTTYTDQQNRSKSFAIETNEIKKWSYAVRACMDVELSFPRIHWFPTMSGFPDSRGCHLTWRLRTCQRPLTSTPGLICYFKGRAIKSLKLSK